MKHSYILVILLALTILLVSCHQTTQTSSAVSGNTSSDTATTPYTSELAYPDSSESSAAMDSGAQQSNAASTSSMASSNGGASPKDSPGKTQSSSKNSKAQPAQSQAPAVPSTAKPPASSAPAVTASPAFDPQTYRDYAITYGQSKGLIYNPNMYTPGTDIYQQNWRPPLNLYPGLTKESIELGIRTQCDALLKDGYKYFEPYLQKQSDGSYQLYFFSA